MSRSLVAFLILASVASACTRGSIDLWNETDQEIVIVQVGDEDETVVGDLPPYGGFSILAKWMSQCLDGRLEARTKDGTVVDEQPGPFCPGDPPWVIGP